jgi:hypothetical protein
MEFSYPAAQPLTIYVGLRDEGVTVWRRLYELTGEILEGERWEFQPGQVFECECRALAGGGESGLVATRLARQAAE